MANTKKAATETATATKAENKKPVKLTDDMMVEVKSCVFGGLIYVDKRTGEQVLWDNEGDIQVVSFELLRSMKASQVAFFKNNWIAVVSVLDNDGVTPADVYKGLYVQQYYKDVIDPDDFEKVCSWSVSEIEKKVSLLVPAARTNLAIALNTFIENGTLDSIKKIKAFEKALGCELSIPN